MLGMRLFYSAAMLHPSWHSAFFLSFKTADSAMLLRVDFVPNVSLFPQKFYLVLSSPHNSVNDLLCIFIQTSRSPYLLVTPLLPHMLIVSCMPFA